MSGLFQILSIVVLFQLFFISFFLFTSKKGRRLSNYLLAFFFLSLGFGLLDYFLMISGFFDQKSQYAFILNGLVIFHAPLLLLYTQSLTSRSFRLKWVHLLHSLLYFLSIGLLVFFYYNQPPEIQASIIEEVKKGKDISSILISVFGLAYELAYLTAVKIRIRAYRRKIKDQFSNIDKINLNWLNFFVNVFILSFLASIVSNAVRHSQIDHLEEGAIIVGLIGLFLFISSVLLKGLHQNEIFMGSQTKSTREATIPGRKREYSSKTESSSGVGQTLSQPRNNVKPVSPADGSAGQAIVGFDQSGIRSNFFRSDQPLSHRRSQRKDPGK